MSKKPMPSGSDEQLADFIAREAWADGERMQKLQLDLLKSGALFQGEADGGARGALEGVKSILRYFEQKRPDWVQRGVLNPVIAAAECLQAIGNGNSNDILKQASVQRRPNAPQLQPKVLQFRGAVAFLIDVKMKNNKSLGFHQCASSIANSLSNAGWPYFKEASILRWRKRAMEGDATVDPDARTYRQLLEKHKGDDPDSFENTLRNVLVALRGITPLTDQKV